LVYAKDLIRTQTLIATVTDGKSLSHINRISTTHSRKWV
jgi:hypothetical protein